MADFTPGAQLKYQCACTLLERRVCKRVDVQLITLLCTWRTYALSERLLVNTRWKCGFAAAVCVDSAIPLISSQELGVGLYDPHRLFLPCNGIFPIHEGNGLFDCIFLFFIKLQCNSRSSLCFNAQLAKSDARCGICVTRACCTSWDVRCLQCTCRLTDYCTLWSIKNETLLFFR